MNKKAKTECVISVNRFTSSDVKFYGSNATHSGGVSLTISTANENNVLTRVIMSAEQFAMLITNVNNGSTPCTLEFYDDVNYERIPVKTTNPYDEFAKSELRNINNNLKELDFYVEELIAKKRATKSELVRIQDRISNLNYTLNNSNYIVNSINKYVEQTVNNAKHDYIAFVNMEHYHNNTNVKKMSPEDASKVFAKYVM